MSEYMQTDRFGSAFERRPRKAEVPREDGVTLEMMREGVRVYLEHCPDTGAGDRLDREMVAEIFVAMAAAQSGNRAA